MGSLGNVKQRGMAPASPDPVIIELNRLENNLREKEREVGAAHCEIKALKVTELLKDKAIVELSNDLKKLEAKIRNDEKLLEDKNIEIKNLNSEKKEALAAQFAAEGTLRRVHANQKDEESVSVEAIVAPYESDIRKYKNEIASLQEGKKALERLLKSKDVALLEAEKLLHSAEERVLTAETIQNQNIGLKRQIEICLEENRLLEKASRQKVVEVEKLSHTIRELEESILAGGSAANIIRDCQRQISELNEEKKILERELARANVSANRVATAIANEWKDESEKVMPVKQWIEERKVMQGEMQRLRDKLAISERTVKAETQLRDKFKSRLKILEEDLKGTSSFSIGGAKTSEQVNGFRSCNGTPRKRSSSQPRASIAGIRTSILQQPNPESLSVEPIRKTVHINRLTTKSGSEENLVRRNLWAPRSKFFDDRGKENAGGKFNSNGHADVISPVRSEVTDEVKSTEYDELPQRNGLLEDGKDDSVSGFLYDRLQKELIGSRKLLEQKDGILNAKDDEIKLLQRKNEMLTKAMEAEVKKIKREAAAKERETSLTSHDNKQSPKVTNVYKRSIMSPKARSAVSPKA